jgi:uncharacterized glyoxalase superfamily protein PhnB
MNPQTSPSGASVIPTVRYRDVGAAIAWLQKAFGLEPHRVVKDSLGNVLYGEVTFGSGMVMIAPVQDSPFGKLMVQPDEVGGVETQICYLPVADTKAHYARAKAAGAEIIFDIDADRDGGGYSCRDPQGHVWNFGTYDPWDREPAVRETPRARSRVPVALLALLIAGTAVYFIAPMREALRGPASAMLSRVAAAIEPAQAKQASDPERDRLTDGARGELHDQLTRERVARADAEQMLKDLREELVRERRSREAAEIAAREARSQAPDGGAGGGTSRAETAAAEARGELAKARAALQVAAEKLARAEKDKEAIEKSTKDALAQFTQLRSAREAAEHAARQAKELAARERSRRMAVERTLRLAKTSPYTPYPLE